MRKSRLFFVLVPLFSLFSCGPTAQKPYILDHDGDLPYMDEAYGYEELTKITDADEVFEMVDAGRDVLLGLFGENCYPCIVLERAFSDFVLDGSIPCLSFYNGASQESYEAFIANSSALMARYGLTMDEVFTPSLFLLSKDEMTRLDLRSNPINTWTAPRLNSLIQKEASRSEVYFFDEEENFLRFVKENDCVEILFDEENQEDSSLFYADFYQKAQKRSQKTAVLDYDEGMEEALAHFGLSGYEATIKAGNEKAPLEEGASLLN